jgi:hypothetical protein
MLMFWLDLAISLLIADFLAALRALSSHLKGTSPPGVRSILSFLMLLLLVWGGGAWVARFNLFSVALYWLPFALVGVIVTLALPVLGPPRRAFRTPMRSEGTRFAGQRGTAFTGFLWLLIFGLAVLIASAYVA